MLRFAQSKPRSPVYAQIDIKDATITFQDGGSGTVVAKIGEGNLTYDERRNVEYTLDRGTIDEVRLGDETPLEVSFQFTWIYLSGSSGSVTMESIIKGADGQTSSDADACRPYACDIVIDLDPSVNNSNCTTGHQIITLADFRWEQLSHDVRAGQVSCSGKCNITEATIDNTT